jgi:putative Ca2+/H+ antiporter (TMEM165/GDT1 family)
MDWKIVASTFLAVLTAEMGDKTQLATMALAAGTSRWAVFTGAAAALTVSTALAVLLGDVIARTIPPVWIRRGAGAFFILIGVTFLAAKA